MVKGMSEGRRNIDIDGECLEQVNKFKQLRAMVNSKGTLKAEINERTAATRKLLNAIKSNFFEKKSKTNTNLRIRDSYLKAKKQTANHGNEIPEIN